MNPGALMLDLESTVLSDEERELLRAAQVGGVILFARNYQSPDQLANLVASVRAVNPDLIIAVDHEGGRVQRFREGFTRVPPMAAFGELYQRDAGRAVAGAREAGWLIATELTSFDIDLSFAPVLDLDFGKSTVIGDRAFSGDVDVLCTLAAAFVAGMHEGGMVATGKHFPGHGGVAADSHTEIPVDNRSLEALLQADLVPFERLAGQLDAIMPAHVIYPTVDEQPAGFSRRWINDILRGRFGFEGVVFSDDLSMEGASVAGGYAERAAVALDAGCDMVLVCNHPEGAREVLGYLQRSQHAGSPRLSALRHRGRAGKPYSADARWRGAADIIENLA